MVSIVILNWNGWSDTIDCLKSIFAVSSVSFSVLVVDNGSANDSVNQIIHYLESLNVDYSVVSEGEKYNAPIVNRKIILYKLMHNYGFAKGNNMGLKLLKGQPVDYYLILNNDTVLEPESISVLENFLNNHSDYCACTPQIRYYSDKNKIWNCGGRLFWGFRKYYYANQCNITFKRFFFDISFVTGCALLVRPSALSNNCLFTERFFFGEEDFELSMRWKQEKQKVACLTSSVIYHKVSASTKNRDTLPKTFIYYLNRYINIKHRFSSVNYMLWKSVNNVWVALLLFRQKHTARDIIHFLSRLNSESKIKDGVEYDYFIKTLEGGIG